MRMDNAFGYVGDMGYVVLTLVTLAGGTETPDSGDLRPKEKTCPYQEYLFKQEHNVFYRNRAVSPDSRKHLRSATYRRTCTENLNEESSETFQFMLSDREALKSSGMKGGGEERVISKFVQSFEAQVGELCERIVVLSNSSKMDYDQRTISYTTPDLGDESRFPEHPLGWLRTKTPYIKQKATASWPRSVFVKLTWNPNPSQNITWRDVDRCKSMLSQVFSSAGRPEKDRRWCQGIPAKFKTVNPDPLWSLELTWTALDFPPPDTAFQGKPSSIRKLIKPKATGSTSVDYAKSHEVASSIRHINGGFIAPVMSAVKAMEILRTIGRHSQTRKDLTSNTLCEASNTDSHNADHDQAHPREPPAGRPRQNCRCREGSAEGQPKRSCNTLSKESTSPVPMRFSRTWATPVDGGLHRLVELLSSGSLRTRKGPAEGPLKRAASLPA